jgi:putative nucleotidyltransferase with HDIG domain
MNDITIEQKLGNIDQLPTLPVVLRQIQKVMRNESANMQQIAQVVAKDQALASRTIRLVNSAYYGLSKRVTSITQAIVILGLNTLNHLMLGLTLVKMFKDAPVRGFDPGEFWKHSFATALIAKKLAGYREGVDPEECFVCGLLHDMGRLILDQHAPGDFKAALDKAKMNGHALRECEKNVFGFTHADAGAWLSIRWQMPDSITATLQYHHAVTTVPDTMAHYARIVGTAAAANELAHMAHIGRSGEHKNSSAALQSLKGLTTDICSTVVKQTRSEVEETIKEWDNAL